jgi:hypothetical protein
MPLKRRHLLLIGIALLLLTALVAWALTGNHHFYALFWAFGRPIPRLKPAWAWAALALLPVPFAVWWACRPGRQAIRLAVLLLCGVALHWAFPLAEGNGSAPAVARVWGGHGELTRIAIEGRDLGNLTARYETLMRTRGWIFPHSKPPGCLLVYQGLVGIADSKVGALFDRLIYGQPPAPVVQARDRRVVSTIFVLLTLATYLTLFPLYLFVRRLADTAIAIRAAALFVVTPAVSLVTLHLDNGLYPLVGATSIALVALWPAAGYWVMGAAGLLLSLGVFASFSLLPLVALAAALPFLTLWRANRAGPWSRDALRALGASAILLAAFCVVHGILVFGFHYDVLARYADARDFHRNWWSGGGHDWRLGNLLQMAIWLGPATAVLFVTQIIRGFARAHHPNRAFAVYGLMVAGMLLATTLAKMAKSEVMRLWAPQVGVLVTVAAARLAAWDEDRPGLLMGALASLQIAYTFVLDRYWIM